MPQALLTNIMAEFPGQPHDEDLNLLSALQIGLEDCQERLDDPDISMDEAFALMHQRNTLDEDLALVQGRLRARGIQAELAIDRQDEDLQFEIEEQIEEQIEVEISEEIQEGIQEETQEENDPAGHPTNYSPNEDDNAEHLAPPHPGDDLTQTEVQETQKCRACLEDFGAHDVKECPCGDEYCENCLERMFVTALTDESSFPPMCCQQRIPANREWKFVDGDLLDKLDLKTEELSTPNRLYCARPGCGYWIRPAFILPNGLGICDNSRIWDNDNNCYKECLAWTCGLCKNILRHDGSDCPQEDELNELAAREGWRKCNSCNRFIELDTGCYHMSKSMFTERFLLPKCHARQTLHNANNLLAFIACRCGAEFCYLCGAAWVDKGQPGACKCILFDAARLVAPAHEPAPEDIWWLAPGPAWGPALEEVVDDNGWPAHPRPHPRPRPNRQPACAHTRWTTLQRPRRCAPCRTRMMKSIEECQDCDTKMCRHCRYNRR